MEGSFTLPGESREVPPGEVVVAQEVVDFQRDRPAWRLHMVSAAMDGMYEALSWQNPIPARDAYEAFFREMAWGALYFAVSPTSPKSAERTAQRLQAVLRFWQPLQSVRYLFKVLGKTLTLDELMSTACDWAIDAWCPVGATSVRERLEVAAQRMARATKEDSIQAVLKQMPRALPFARGLKHPEVLADPEALRQHLLTLDAEAFARVSGACTSALLEYLYDWDYDLGMQ